MQAGGSVGVVPVPSPIRMTPLLNQRQLLKHGWRNMIKKTRGFREQHPAALVEYINWIGEIQVTLGPGYRHIEEPTFLLQFLISNKRVDRRKLSIDHPNYKHALPFQTLCRMDRRQDHPLIIAIRGLHIHRTPIRRFEGKVGKKT